MRLRWLLPVSVLAAMVTARASADPGVDLRTFRPSTDKTGTLATESADTPGPGKFQFGVWSAFATPILKIHEVDGSQRTTKSQLVLDPSVAIGIGERGAVGLTLPVLLSQTGEASSFSENKAVSSQGIGDVTLTGKANVTKPAKDALGGLGVALLARIQIPTGDRSSLISDDGLVSELRALVTYDYVHTLLFAMTAGFRTRQHSHDVADVTLGDSIPWGATLSFKPRAVGWDDKGRWTWNLEAHGEIGATPNKLFADSRTSPVLVGPSIRYEFSKDFSLFLGVETGLTQALGGPRIRGVLGIFFAPTVIDEDGDGVPDDVDECPGLAGDKSGPQPGCPTYESGPPKAPSADDEIGPPLDTDTDTIPDAEDKCPNEPETFDGIDDADGCPEAASKLPADRDRDNVPDDADKCPDAAETVNGYQDDDGCPEVDADNDTFLDDVDKCPNDPETFNAFQDDDGCADAAPKPVTLVVEGGKDGEGDPVLTLSRTIKFDGDAPNKDAASDLRALAQWLLVHPGQRVKIAVKVEGAGKDAEAKAAARAATIVQQLVVYAHTGGAAEAMSWSTKIAPKTSNVEIDVTKSIGLEEGSTEK